MIRANAKQRRRLRLAMLAIKDVRKPLQDYADETDEPAWEAVEAADLLDTVSKLLEGAVAGLPAADTPLVRATRHPTANAARSANRQARTT